MFFWRSFKRTPLIVAHRGSSRIAPENTLAAFRKALDAGADAIELDVHLSKDGEVVVIHDHRLERTTNGRGRVADFTLSELRRLSAGDWFSQRFTSERIPTLGEVLNLLRLRIGVNVEIKYDRPQRADLTIVERCCNIIKEHDAGRSVMISSFYIPFLKLVKSLEPKIVTGMLYPAFKLMRRSPLKSARAVGAEFIISGGTALRKRIVDHAHESDLFVGEYTVNTRHRFDRAMRFGVDALLTDDPAGILHFLRSR